VGALAISGVPPFNGFAAKKLVLSALDSGSARIVGILLWTTAIGTVASFIKLSAIFWRRPGNTAVESRDRRRTPFMIYSAAGILGALCVATGIGSRFWQKLIFALLYGDSTEALVSASPVYTLSGILESMIPVVLGAGLYLLLRTRRGRLMMTVIRDVHVSLDGAAIMVVAGFVALGGLALFAL
jgi:multicomponent Na+:H+ antiporter subunit D